MSNNTLEFKTAERLVEYVRKVCADSGLIDARVKFPADVTGVSPSGNWVYISISQEYDEKYYSSVYKRKLSMSLLANKNDFMVMVKRLGLSSAKDFSNQKWEFQGKLSFFKPKAQFSVFIDTIAPLGESELKIKRREIYLALKAKAAIMDKKHDLSELHPIKKIAVVSSRKAAGYGDFVNNVVLDKKYRPIVHLYDSFMQGSSTVKSVMEALSKIYACPVKYDVIVITRGGGAASDLMYFDDYDLGLRISKLNRDYCPVLSAIGHEKDSTIPDFVAWQKFDTPTAVAKAITDQIRGYVELVDSSWANLNIRLENWLIRAESSLDYRWLSYLRGKTGDALSNSELACTQLYQNLNREIRVAISGAEKDFTDYDLTRLGSTLDSSVAEIIKDISYDFGSIGRSVENTLHRAAGLLELNHIPYAMGSLVSENKFNMNALDGNLKISINDFEKTADSELNLLAAGLRDHGGYAASLLSGGVVLKKGSIVARSIKDIEVGDRLENYFVDGVAVSEITRIK